MKSGRLDPLAQVIELVVGDVGAGDDDHGEWLEWRGRTRVAHKKKAREDFTGRRVS